MDELGHYPDARCLLLLCDGGGSNASNRHVFKEALQHLVDRLGLEICVAHYPPYCSKHNPVEHRLLAHVTPATGLTVTAEVLGGVYVKGKKVATDFLVNRRIVFNTLCPAGTTVLSRPMAEIGKSFLTTS